MYDAAQQARYLEKARKALARGKLKAALRHASDAGLAATWRNDPLALQAVVDLVLVIRDQAEGAVHREADRIAVYFQQQLADARSAGGQRRRSLLGRLLQSESTAGFKSCPDCAETIRAAARVCRFCGYRFGEPTEDSMLDG